MTLTGAQMVCIFWVEAKRAKKSAPKISEKRAPQPAVIAIISFIYLDSYLLIVIILSWSEMFLNAFILRQ